MEVAEQGGGVLVVRIVHVRSGSCLQVSVKGAKDRQKTRMLRIAANEQADAEEARGLLEEETEENLVGFRA